MEKLNQYSLMVGDWVRNDLGETQQVAELHEHWAMLSYNDTYPYDWLEPIPLTPEILEKNGFKYDGSGQRSMMLMTPHGVAGTRWNIYVGLKHKTIDVFSAPPVEKSPGWRKHNKVYLEVCGCYVHELQHCLKLCRIDKTIVL